MVTDAQVRIRSEFSALRSGRLWLALAACATTTGGVLSTYSYIAPLLTGRSGIAAGLVPLVLVGFGIGALAGTLLGGRLGDTRPHATTITAAAATTVILLAIALLSTHAAPTAVLVALLGLFGLGANPVLMALAVRYAGSAPTLGSSLTVSAFNLGTALGSWLTGLALASGLGPGRGHRRHGHLRVDLDTDRHSGARPPHGTGHAAHRGGRPHVR